MLADQLTVSGSTLREVVSSQPLARFWALQWWESGVFLVLAGGLTLLAFDRIRRRTG